MKTFTFIEGILESDPTPKKLTIKTIKQETVEIYYSETPPDSFIKTPLSDICCKYLKKGSRVLVGAKRVKEQWYAKTVNVLFPKK